MNVTVGERIRTARKQAGMTQRELADKLEISYVGVSQWESGRRNPKESTLARIADVLDVPLNYLMGTHFIGHSELADFVNRSWPRADYYLKGLKNNDGDAEEIERWERVCAELCEIRDEIRAEQQTEQVKLSDQEKQLLDIFRNLSAEGRRKVLAIAFDYAKIKEYSPVPETGG